MPVDPTSSTSGTRPGKTVGPPGPRLSSGRVVAVPGTWVLNRPHPHPRPAVNPASRRPVCTNGLSHRSPPPSEPASRGDLLRSTRALSRAWRRRSEIALVNTRGTQSETVGPHGWYHSFAMDAYLEQMQANVQISRFDRIAVQVICALISNQGLPEDLEEQRKMINTGKRFTEGLIVILDED